MGVKVTLPELGESVEGGVLVTWLVASLPLGLFLVTSSNSSAWGIAGLGTVWANAITASTPGGRVRRVSAALLAVLGAIMALGARTEALPHLLVILAAVTVLVALDLRRDPGGNTLAWMRSLRLPARLGIAASGVGMVVVALLLTPSTLRSVFGNLSSGWERLTQRGIGNPAVSLSLEVPQFWTGTLGTWSLGWLDTPVPPLSSTLAVAAYSALLWAGLTGAGRGRIAATITTLVALIALPVYSLISLGLIVQEELQARHYMPLIYLLLGLALVRSRGQGRLIIGRGARVTLTAALGIAHAATMHINIRRYTVGLTELRSADTSRTAEWWWPTGPGPTLVWLTASVAFAVLAWLVLGLLRDSRPGATR
jgi:hypothetical protein